jgi:hypothetical protein
MKNRRFGHTSIYYNNEIWHIGGHFADGYSIGMESWTIKEKRLRYFNSLKDFTTNS